jgi:type II secretory pathway pseudopilin PulG
MSRSRLGQNQGFTILEAAAASAMLVMLVAALALSLTQINCWASAARLKTLALAAAQEKVDEVLTTSWKVRNPAPAALVDSQPDTTPETTETLVLNNDALNSQSTLSSAYTALDTPVNATRKTWIKSLTTRSVRAVVTVDFTYRGRTYSTALTTLRVTDDI